MQLGLLVATCGSLLLHFLYALFYGFEVLDLQLGIDNLLVAHGVYGTVYVGHIIIVEAAEHVDDGVSLTDIGQKLVAQSLALARTLHEAGNINNLHSGGYDTSRMYQLGQLGESVIGNRDNAHIGLDCTERKVCRLRLSV